MASGIEPSTGASRMGEPVPNAQLPGTEPSDEALLARIAGGDSDALGALYDRYARVAIAVAYRVLGEHGAAEDVVQEAFLAVWRRVDSFDADRGTVRSWLLTIVAQWRGRPPAGPACPRAAGCRAGRRRIQACNPGEETFEMVASTVEAERVREALATLPTDQREAIELAYFGGLTHQEIAQRTGPRSARSRAECGWVCTRSAPAWRPLPAGRRRTAARGQRAAGEGTGAGRGNTGAMDSPPPADGALSGRMSTANLRSRSARQT